MVEENKQELKGAWFNKKILILKQIPTSNATRITPMLQIQNVVKLPKVEHWKIGVERHMAERWKVGLNAIQFVKPSAECCWDKAERWHRWHVKKWIFNLVSREGLVHSSFCTIERLLGVLGSSPTPPWVFSSIHGGFSPLYGLERKMGCDWEMETQMGGTLEAWSVCQEPWEKTCIFSLVSVYSISLQFVNPRFSTMES